MHRLGLIDNREERQGQTKEETKIVALVELSIVLVHPLAVSACQDDFEEVRKTQGGDQGEDEVRP